MDHCHNILDIFGKLKKKGRFSAVPLSALNYVQILNTVQYKHEVKNLTANILYTLVNLVKILVLILQVLMFGRAVMSWITMGEDEENRLYKFLFYTTEPIVLPIRNLMNKIEFFNNIPIDMSFMAALILLYLISALLPDVRL